MIRALHTRWSRGTAWFLAWAIIVPLVFTSPPRADAQSIRRIKQQRVVVLSVADITARPAGEAANQVLEQTALDNLWRQLHENSHYLPVPVRDLERELENLQLTPPYRPVQQQMVAEALLADVVLTGYIVDRGITLVKGDRQAGVTLQVLLRDALTGENVNGATIRQTSRIIPGDTRSDVELLNEAVEMAAIDAVTQMARYEIPQGAVIIAQTGVNLKINIGQRHGVKDGMQFVLLRKAYDRGTGKVTLEPAGKIRASQVFGTESECEAADGTKIVLPEDVVRAVWVEEPLRPDEQNPTTGQGGRNKEKKHRNNTKIVLGAALLGLIALVAVRAARGDEGTVRARSITALPTAGVIPSEAVVGDAGPRAPSIRVTWPVPAAPATAPVAGRPYIVGYEVHRSSAPGFAPSPATLQAVLAGGNVHEYVDSAVKARAEHVSLKCEPAREYDYTVEPVEPGARYFYVVQAIISGLSAGKTDATRLYDIGPATALGRPALVGSHSASGSLADRVFEFEPAPGADTYVIQVSDTPSFVPDRTLTSLEITSRGTERRISSPFSGPDVRNAFTGGQVFWRVGAMRGSDARATGMGIAYSEVRALSN